jgi:hypothetical protein
VPSRVDQLCRFERLGLKWNPFRVVAPSENSDVYIPDLYRTATLAREVALSDSPLTQVVARAGHGKSTFLAAVADTLEEAGISFESLYLQPSLWARVRVPGKNVRVLILDESERLSRLNLRKLSGWTRRGGRLIVSAHRDQFNSPFSGLPPCPATIAFPQITLDGLQQFFLTRLRWAGDVDQRFELADDGAEWLLFFSEGNLRVVEAVLYEIFQVAADELASHSDPSAIKPTRRRIDSENLKWLEDFAKRRAAFEAEGNTPFSRWRLMSQFLRKTTSRIVGWFSGRTSTPGPAERELPR